MELPNRGIVRDESAPANDQTNPWHYTRGEVECIDALRSMLGKSFIDYCAGTAVAYIWRARVKGNIEEDLKKAIWYLKMASGNDPRPRRPSY